MSDCPPGCLVNFNISHYLLVWFIMNNIVSVGLLSRRTQLPCGYILSNKPPLHLNHLPLLRRWLTRYPFTQNKSMLKRYLKQFCSNHLSILYIKRSVHILFLFGKFLTFSAEIRQEGSPTTRLENSDDKFLFQIFHKLCLPSKEKFCATYSRRFKTI